MIPLRVLSAPSSTELPRGKTPGEMLAHALRCYGVRVGPHSRLVLFLLHAIEVGGFKIVPDSVLPFDQKNKT